MFIDTHVHLNGEQFADTAQIIIDSMPEDGLDAVICVGFDRPSSELGLELAKKNKNVYCALGIHPHDSKDAGSDDYYYFAINSAHKKVVAIGEIGLDYYYNFSPRDTQRRVFAEQIQLAKTTGLPIIIHLREAFEDTLEILKQNKRYLINGGVVHCYSGSLEVAKILLDMGLLLSFGGAVTYKNAVRALEVIAAIPLRSIMLETDCPYMSPEPLRGTLNVPKNIHYAAEAIARLKGISVEEVAAITRNNALGLFKKIKLKKAKP